MKERQPAEGGTAARRAGGAVRRGAIVLAVLAGVAMPGRAADLDTVEFVRALAANNYHDVAVDYLRMLKDGTAGEPLPANLAEIWDLEMANCLREAAKRAYDRADYERKLAESQEHLDRFLKEKPNHPEAMSAMVSSGSFLVEEALRQIEAAKAEKDPNKAAALMQAARQGLETARVRFRRADEFYFKKYKALPPRAPVAATVHQPAGRGRGRVPRPTAQSRQAQAQEAARRELLGRISECRVKIAAIDYYVATTLPSGDPQRSSLLAKASRGLDDIWQRNRGELFGLMAHRFDAMVREEMNDLETAVEIYQEILPASNPDEASADARLDALVQLAAESYFKILLKKNAEQFAEEADAWLGQFRRMSRSDGYQGIALLLAKYYLESKDAKDQAEGKKMLEEMVRVRSSHQKAASALLGTPLPTEGAAEDVPAVGKPEDARNLAQAAALAEKAIAAKQWELASQFYQRAAEFAERGTSKDQARIPEFREGYAKAKLEIARQHYADKKYDEACEIAKDLVVKLANTKAAPGGAAIGCAACVAQFADAPDDAARQKHAKNARTFGKLIEEKWPGTPEEDAVNMELARLLFSQKQRDEALKLLDRVGEKSKHYAAARYWLGLMRWQRCQTLLVPQIDAAVKELARLKQAGPADKAPEAEAKLAELNKTAAAERRDAREAAEASWQRRKAAVGDAEDKLPPPVFESQLLLGAILISERRTKEGLEMLEPLVEKVKAAGSKGLDASLNQLFATLINAHLEAGDYARLVEVGEAMVAAAADKVEDNATLVKLAGTLERQRKAAEAAWKGAKTSVDANLAEGNLRKIQKAAAAILAKICRHKDFTISGLVVLGEACAATGDSSLEPTAAEMFEKVLSLQKSEDAALQAEAKRYALLARRRLVKLMTAKGEFAKADKYLSDVMNEHKKNLPLKKERCALLAAWAEKDPAKRDEAAAEYKALRDLLYDLKGKAEYRSEYFEVNLELARSLFQQAQKAPDKKAAQEKAVEAGRYLNAELITEAIKDEAMREKYQDLLKQLRPLMPDTTAKPPPAATGTTKSGEK